MFLRNIFVVSAVLLTLICSSLFAAPPESEGLVYKPNFQPNPKIRPWQDYPFVKAPDRHLRKTLWQNFDELPAWSQRGNIRYFNGAYTPKRVDEIKEAGGIGHVGPIRALTTQVLDYMKAQSVPFIMRLDGQLFWGRNYTQIMEAIRPGGWARYHSTVPNTQWYTKFPPSLSATKVRRDGELMIEYSGSKWVQRRDPSFVHPVSIQMRDAFLREYLLGEQVFDIPLDLKTGGYASGVWWDNPGNVVHSFDPYATWLLARDFKKKFGARYHDKKANDQAYYGDPPHFWMKYHDREVQRWYEKFWADAYAGYYAWQYKFLQETVAPKLGKKHLFVGGNSKLNWSTANWDYYLFSWPNTYDVLGPCETSPVYSNKEAPGLKLAMAASNGKPAGIWRTPKNPGLAGELLSTLAVTVNPDKTHVNFLKVNTALYHNAMPGGRIAVLYHLLDGIHHSEIANLSRVCDQIWRTGSALEVITELHLTPEVLKQFDMLVVPGFRFSDREVASLRSYVAGGGKVLMLGDNRDHEDHQLSQILADVPAFTDATVKVGKGTIQAVGRQLITQSEMDSAVDTLSGKGYRIISSRGQDMMLNILTQPAEKLTEAHLVNYTTKPIHNVKVRLPADLKAKYVALISPSGRDQSLTVVDNTITIPVLIGYAVAVICPDATSRDTILASNETIADLPVPQTLPSPRVHGQNDKTPTMEPGDLDPGQRLVHLRQSGRTGFRRIDADITTKATGQVGQPQPIQLKLHAVGVWSANLVHLDKVKFVMVNTQTGQREEVSVNMGTVSGTAEGDDMRQRKDFTLPAGSRVLRETFTNWTPAAKGTYQIYLGYRYVHEGFDGKPMPAAKNPQKDRYDLGNYMYGRPLQKLSYEDRLPCMVVTVNE